MGDHVEQKGSYVDKDTLRFDFSHFQKVTDEELRKVEHMVNEMIRADYPLDEHRDTPIEEAKELALSPSSAKYGDKGSCGSLRSICRVLWWYSRQEHR